MPRPRCNIKRLIVFLLFGAIVNIGVAWTSSFAQQYLMQFRCTFSTTPRPTPPPSLPSDWQDLHLIADEDRFVSRFEQFVDSSNRVLVTDFYSGWPLLSVVGTLRWDSTGAFTIPPHVFIWLNRGTIGYCVPVVPLWPGFAINTIFYAAILWLLFIALNKIRCFFIRGRIKRNRCPACGYKIAQGVGPVCSECGHALPPRRGDGM